MLPRQLCPRKIFSCPGRCSSKPRFFGSGQNTRRGKLEKTLATLDGSAHLLDPLRGRVLKVLRAGRLHPWSTARQSVDGRGGAEAEPHHLFHASEAGRCFIMNFRTSKEEASASMWASCRETV